MLWVGMLKTKEERIVTKKILASAPVISHSSVCSLLPLSHFTGGIEIFLSLNSYFVLCCPSVSQKLLSTHLLNVDRIALVGAFSGCVPVCVCIPVRDWVPKGEREQVGRESKV